MNKYVRELLLWVVIVLPYAYLAYSWHELPERVPTHFNINGEADDWSHRTILFFLPCILPAGIYLLMLLLPVLDPKRRLQQMGDKYHSLRLMLVVFMSGLAIYMLYITKEGRMANPQWLIALIGLMVAMLGNYFQALRPNYFVGIRTPWTLENEEVWKKTHYLGARLWVGGGLLMIILSFLIHKNTALLIAAGSIFLIIVGIPIIFSFLEFKKQEQLHKQG
jgi:uncharacterized membrane protein